MFLENDLTTELFPPRSFKSCKKFGKIILKMNPRSYGRSRSENK